LFPAYRESSAAVDVALREIRSITDESARVVTSPAGCFSAASEKPAQILPEGA